MFRAVLISAFLTPAFALALDRPISSSLSDLQRAHPEYAKLVEGEYFAKALTMGNRVLLFNASPQVATLDLKRDGWWMPTTIAKGFALDLTARDIRLRWSTGSEDATAAYKLEAKRHYWIDWDSKAKRPVLFVLP